ncbi:MAG: hypothetical protein KKA05_04290 [Alphaproteobacteria bacterium]|nr:hypothetical protein [Alphaproteobacteria bacterium]MBU0859141.1 hypothetical protein [Alphaproteobacteria bacterium]
MAADNTAKTIAASRELQKRVGTGEIDEKVVKKAQTVMDTNTVDFGPLARPYLTALTTAVAEARKVPGVMDKQTVETLSVPIMNLKANAATFNYSLISGLTGVVLTFIESHEKPGRKTLQVVELLNKTIMLLVARKMTGDGGEIGNALQKAFKDVCRWCIEKEA